MKYSSKNYSIVLLLLSFFILSFDLKNDNIHENIQVGYQILKTDNQNDLNFCINAIENADWCNERYLDKSHLIIFDSGLEVELFSVQEMNNNGISISNECISTNEVNGSKETWKFSESGFVLKANKGILTPDQKINNQH